MYIFKSAGYGSRWQLKREIYTLERIKGRWPPGDPDRPRVPLLFDLVTNSSIADSDPISNINNTTIASSYSQPSTKHNNNNKNHKNAENDDTLICGLLEDFIDGDPLSELLDPPCHYYKTRNNDDDRKKDSNFSPSPSPLPLATERQRWKTQIDDTVAQLHANGIIWGDVKDANVLIERKTRDAWLIDFGGSVTDGWVDE